jgi:hypothetical protein
MGVFAYIGAREKSQETSRWALTPDSDATLAMAAASWAMWRASERLERERMSQMIESRAFVTRTAESDLNEEAGGPSGRYPVTAVVQVIVAH